MKLFFRKLLELVSAGSEINFAKESVLARYLRPLGANRTTLEIGCSVGETYPGADGLFYTGLDLSQEFLKVLREKTKNNSISLVLADAAKMPFADDSYQFIYTITTLELLDPAKVRSILSECTRVGAEDAICIFQFFNSRSLQYAFTKNSHWRGDCKFRYYTLNLNQSRSLIREMGFTIMEEFHYTFIPYFVVNKLGRPWLARLDFRLSSLWPGLAAKNLYVCRLAGKARQQGPLLPD